MGSRKMYYPLRRTSLLYLLASLTFKNRYRKMGTVQRNARPCKGQALIAEAGASSLDNRDFPAPSYHSTSTFPNLTHRSWQSRRAARCTAPTRQPAEGQAWSAIPRARRGRRSDRLDSLGKRNRRLGFRPRETSEGAVATAKLYLRRCTIRRMG